MSSCVGHTCNIHIFLQAFFKGVVSADLNTEGLDEVAEVVEERGAW